MISWEISSKSVKINSKVTILNFLELENSKKEQRSSTMQRHMMSRWNKSSLGQCAKAKKGWRLLNWQSTLKVGAKTKNAHFVKSNIKTSVTSLDANTCLKSWRIRSIISKALVEPSSSTPYLLRMRYNCFKILPLFPTHWFLIDRLSLLATQNSLRH